MIAKLPIELVEELERAGNQPLPVEDPTTKRMYVLVDVERYEVVRRTPGTPARASSWTQEKNERRCSLIRKKFSQGIDADEARELGRLQEELSVYRKESASLPYDVVDVLQAALDSSPPSS
jgi:hypothetical protein